MALKELVITLARGLVDEPDQVEVTEAQGNGNALVLELRVAKTDIGKVIGKDGRTAQSLRAVVTAAAMKAGRRAHLDILD